MENGLNALATALTGIVERGQIILIVDMTSGMRTVSSCYMSICQMTAFARFYFVFLDDRAKFSRK